MYKRYFNGQTSSFSTSKATDVIWYFRDMQTDAHYNKNKRKFIFVILQ